MFSKKDESSPHEHNKAEARSQQCRFATLLKSHPRTGRALQIHIIAAEHPPPGEHLCGTACACQKNFKRIKL